VPSAEVKNLLDSLDICRTKLVSLLRPASASSPMSHPARSSATNTISACRPASRPASFAGCDPRPVPGHEARSPAAD